jgi:hypothetical protein
MEIKGSDVGCWRLIALSMQLNFNPVRCPSTLYYCPFGGIR